MSFDFEITPTNFGIRFVAHFLDSVVIYILSMFLGGIIFSFLFTGQKSFGNFIVFSVVVTTPFGFILIAPIYYLQEIFIGKTIGKAIFGISVGNDYNFCPANNKELLTRYVLKNIISVGIWSILFCEIFLAHIFPISLFSSILVVIVWLVVMAGGVVILLGNFMVFGVNVQTLYDRLACTIVAKETDLKDFAIKVEQMEQTKNGLDEASSSI